jgi:hypothetical protein
MKIIIPNNDFCHIILPRWVKENIHKNCKCDCLKYENFNNKNFDRLFGFIDSDFIILEPFCHVSMYGV